MLFRSVRHAKRKILVGLVFDFIYSDEKILKGTEDPKAQQVYLEKEAYKVIESRLDIVTIVREINKLKVLSHMFLKDYHRKMVPLVSLSLHLQDKTNRGLSRKLSSIFAGINVISKKYIPPQQRNRRKDDQEDSEGDNNYGTPFENVKNSIRQMVKNKKISNSASRIAVPNSSMEMDLESRVDAYFQSKLQNSAEIFSIPQDLISHKTFVQGGNEQSPINSQQQPIVIQMKSPLKQVSQDARYEISTNSTGKLIGKPSLRPVTANTLAKTKIAASPKHFEEIKSHSPLVNQREWIVSQNLIHPESVYPSSTPQQLPLSLNSKEQMTQPVSSTRRGLVDKGVEEVQTHTVGDGREDQGVHLSASHGLPNDTRSPSRFQPDHHIHRSVRHLN